MAANYTGGGEKRGFQKCTVDSNYIGSVRHGSLAGDKSNPRFAPMNRRIEIKVIKHAWFFSLGQVIAVFFSSILSRGTTQKTRETVIGTDCLKQDLECRRFFGFGLPLFFGGDT